jgi:hypothetical protein
MSEPQQVTEKGPNAFPGPNDPPREWLRENAAYTKVRDALERDHLGEFVVLFRDDVLGPFKTYGEAVWAACRHFGDVQLMVKEIHPDGPPEWVNYVDLNHPSIVLLDKKYG